jgi:flagellin-like protein
MSITKRRAISPILATVLLLAVTVVGGGLVYSTFAQASNTATESSNITVLDANLIAIDEHGSFSMTIKNSGTKSWKSVAINAYKGQLPAVIFYRPLGWSVSDGSFSPDPVVPSKVADLLPADNTSGVIGIGNLISYSTTNPIPWFMSFYPSTLCDTATGLIGGEFYGWADSNGCTGGFSPFVGNKLANPIEPGMTLSPASFVLTKPITDSSGALLFPHDTVKSGDKLVISIIVENTDGSKTQKDVEVKVT